jgi:hypothetical protein
MKVKAWIAFYDFKKVQGWRWWAIKWLTGSIHTHAHIEIQFAEPVAFVVGDRVKAKVMRLSTLEKLGAVRYWTYDLGCLYVTNRDLKFVQQYRKPNSIVMIFYLLLGKWLGMQHPVSCISFICDYLTFKGWEVPNLFTPRELWETLNADNHVRWTGPSRKDDTCQMAE